MILQHCHPCVSCHLLAAHVQQVAFELFYFLLHFPFEKIDSLQLVPVLVCNVLFFLLSGRLELIVQTLIVAEILDPLANCCLVLAEHLFVLLDLIFVVAFEIFVLVFGVKFVVFDLLFEFFNLVVEATVFYLELVLFMGEFLNMFVFGVVVYLKFFHLSLGLLVLLIVSCVLRDLIVFHKCSPIIKFLDSDLELDIFPHESFYFLFQLVHLL